MKRSSVGPTTVILMPSRSQLPKIFAQFNALHLLRPINDDADFRDAQAVSDRLAALAERTTDQEDYWKRCRR